MNRRLLALSLILFILLSGCNLFSDSESDEPGPTAPEEPVDTPQEDAPVPEPEPVEPLALPVTNGIDWNDAPAQSVGEGGPAPDTVSRPLFQYNASGYCTYDTADSGVPDERGVLVRANTVEITGLRNLILQNRLNEFIDTHMQELFDEDPGVTQAELAEYAARSGAAHACVERSAYVNVMISGRVLTLEFNRVDSLLALDEQGEYFPTDEWVELASSDEFFSFDMHDGRQLRLRDLFFDGAEYAPVLDDAIADVLSLSEDEYRLKRPFRGLPEDYPLFSVSSGWLNIQFPADNPYTEMATYVTIRPDSLYEICSILYEDPSAYLTEEVTVNRTAFSYSVSASAHALNAAAADPEDGPFYSPRLRSGAPQDVLDAINAALDVYETRFATLDYLPDELTGRWDELSWHSFYVDYRLIGSLFCLSYETQLSGMDEFYYYTDYITFDLRDGRQLTAADLLVPSDALDAALAEHGITDSLDTLTSVSVGYSFDTLIATPKMDEQVVDISAEHFNFAILESEVAQ